MWNGLPVEIKMAKSISSFKEKLKSLLFFRLNNIFNQDNIGTYKLICPKCRSSGPVHTNANSFESVYFLIRLGLPSTLTRGSDPPNAYKFGNALEGG